VIPVLNAERYLPELLEAIFGQSVEVREVILVDSMSTDATAVIAAKHKRVRVVPIEKFSHGRARNLGAREADGEVIALLTQDALPSGKNWLSELIAPLDDEKVAATFSRQVPRADANPMERYFLQTHFPSGEQVVMCKDGERPLAFQREVFLSNVSAVVRRDTLLRFPFDEELIMSEDQQFARDVLEAGYAVVYCPSSVVIHSHNYSLKTVFQRYFDSVYSVTKLFKSHKMKDSAAMGMKYLWKEALFILRHYPLWTFYYIFYTMAKSVGTLTGHFADKLPRRLVRRMSMHSYYWE